MVKMMSIWAMAGLCVIAVSAALSAGAPSQDPAGLKPGDQAPDFALPGSDGMVAADGFGLDSATGDMYVTDIFGNSIWRFSPGGSAQLWTSFPANTLPDGVKVFNKAVYVSAEHGQILRIPINPDGSAGAAQVWAQVSDYPNAFFDDMTLDDRTGDVYVSRLDTSELLQITPGGAITPIATHADGLLGAANMVLIHAGQSTLIYIANGTSC
jgi:sugar lactone lactonase YvrE